MDAKETSPGGIEAFRGRLLGIAAANGGRPAEASSEPAPREPPRASDLLPLSDVGQEASALAPERQFLRLVVDLKGLNLAVLKYVEAGSAVSSDQVLFRDIRNAYEKAMKEHGWRLGMLLPEWLHNALLSGTPKFLSRILQAVSSIYLYKMDSADFVRFELDPSEGPTHPVQFKTEFPPEAVVASRQYVYDPVPMGVEIVNVQLAHLLKPSAQHQGRFWLSTVPKKPLEGTRQPVLGWGLRINQRLNWAAVLFLLALVLVVVGVIARVYAVMAGNVFVLCLLGAYLAAKLDLWLAIQYLSWKENVYLV